MIRGNSHHSIREIESLKDLIRGKRNLRQATIQNIDFTQTEEITMACFTDSVLKKQSL